VCLNHKAAGSNTHFGEETREAQFQRPLLDCLIKLPANATPDGVLAAIEHIEMAIKFEFGEGYDFAIFFCDQRISSIVASDLPTTRS
jgi:hypothetical protein